ncbi:hypothetical protein FQN53_005191, partial [Emmonsiellopsis sp. PD_33]
EGGEDKDKGDGEGGTTGDAEGNEGKEESPDKKPKEPSAPRNYAVKGDRSGTGGVKKPKLTEDELTERMKAVKLKAAERAAAHARAEADEASFHERERVALEKRREEHQNRRAMNGEREKNRLRKLNAQGGREWDAEKSAEAFSGRGGPARSSAYRRGAHGGVAYDRGTTGSPGEAVEGDEPVYEGDGSKWGPDGGVRGRGSGRGTRGGRGRGAKGRGDYFGKAPHGAAAARNTTSSPPQITAEDEFPSLPQKGPDVVVPVAQSRSAENLAENIEATSPISPLGTWADQVESSVGESLEGTLAKGEKGGA